jgi:propionyl-CoA carboxylase beta chain
MKTKIDLLQDKVKQAQTGGGAVRIESQHKKGKLTARERIHFLMDENTFEEIGMMVTHRSTDFGMEREKYLGDGVVTGYGEYQRTPGLCIFTGFYGFRRIFIRNSCRKDL